nr:unnamed protein product [Callosobruchus analis]
MNIAAFVVVFSDLSYLRPLIFLYIDCTAFLDCQRNFYCDIMIKYAFLRFWSLLI